jgi:transcription antitermination protein NusB
MTTRRRAREVVLQVLYEDDMNPTRDMMLAKQFIESRMLRNKPLIAFGEELLAGVRKRRNEIDSLVGQHAANWSVKRMSTIDRNVIRLATYEMVFGKVPGRVVINEAIELAKRYGHVNSGSFVNGILDKILRETSKKEATPSSESPSTISSQSVVGSSEANQADSTTTSIA